MPRDTQSGGHRAGDEAQTLNTLMVTRTHRDRGDLSAGSKVGREACRETGQDLYSVV